MQVIFHIFLQDAKIQLADSIPHISHIGRLVSFLLKMTKLDSSTIKAENHPEGGAVFTIRF